MASAEGLRVRGLSASYDGAPVLNGIDLDLGRSEIGALLGSNGSGKTTLLRCLAGLEIPAAGAISWDGRAWEGVPTHRRGIGFVFQEAALFPDRTVGENVAYGLELRRWSSERIESRLTAILARLGLSGLYDRRADALSGGERQRVALARTLAPQPPLVLLDEPFASIDPEFRSALRRDFRRVLAEEHVAAIHVTHDPEEALAVADHLFLLRAGRVAQSGPPAEVFSDPVDEAAARFLGYESIGPPTSRVAFLARELEVDPTGGRESISATVEEVRPGAGESVLAMRAGDGSAFTWRRTGAAGRIDPGTMVALRPRRRLLFSTPAPD